MGLNAHRLAPWFTLAALACDTGQSAQPGQSNAPNTGSSGSVGFNPAGAGTSSAGQGGQQGGQQNDGGATANGGSAGSDPAAGGIAGDAGAANTAGAGGESEIPNTGMDAPGTRIEYTPDTSEFPNPERGFYRYDLLTSAAFDYVREDGKTLVYTNVELQDYLGDNHEQELPAALLTEVQAGFDAVRSARLKAIVRFRYDSGAGYPGGTNDAPEAWIINHIEQLAPLLVANEDVIFLVQAGFIGAWGEWHTSNNFVDGEGDAAARGRVVDALLAALPTSRRTAVRYPAYKRMLYGNSATVADDLTLAQAIGRVGHLNDCFVSGPEDVGTYQYEDVDVLRDYLEQDSAFVPNGGETCAVHERNACPTTLAEMERFHFSYINDDYHPDVLQRWTDDGCRPEIERRLGYRLALLASELPEAVRPGGSFTLSVELDNEGFAAPVNPRPVFLVLERAGERSLVDLNQEVRTWVPGPVTITARIQVPSDAAPGDWRVALWLPDAAEGLRDLAEYSVRLAAADVWQAPSGDNTLGTMAVSDAAPGDATTAAQTWSLIAQP
jgi:hypothetical protein